MKGILVFSFIFAFANCKIQIDVGKQKDVLEILYKVSETSSTTPAYNPVEHCSDFKDGCKAAQKLDQKLTSGSMTPRDRVFSLFNPDQRAEAIKVFEVFIQCNTWEIFHKSAEYYRYNVNQGIFVYAYYVAVMHSEVGNGVVLPPLYEVTPYMFVNSEVVDEVHKLLIYQSNTLNDVIHMNSTGSKRNPEQKLAYFGEDIGMNYYHVSWHMEHPFWWDDQKHGHNLDRKGELFMWVHHQMTARYDMERLANNLNFVDELYWGKPIKDGFAPHMKYRFGGEFPFRTDNKNFEDVRGVATIPQMKNYERRLRDSIDRGFARGANGNHVSLSYENGTEIVGDLLESSEYSINPQYYGSLHNYAHIVLGKQSDPEGKYNLPPSVMEHFETAARDPAFFRLHKHLDTIYKQQRDTFAPYKREEVDFPNVRVKSVDILGKLETFFEKFKFNLVNMLPKDSELNVHAEVDRINHEPFDYKYEVENQNSVDKIAVIRVFLCPTEGYNGAYMPFNERRWKCMEMDKFLKKLPKKSTTTFTRSSTDSTVTLHDPPHFEELKQYKTELDTQRSYCAMPNRLLLPKGRKSGMNLRFFFVVSDAEEDFHADALKNFDETAYINAHCGDHGHFHDKRPLGYPLDREFDEDFTVLNIPNQYKKLVTVTHREN